MNNVSVNSKPDHPPGQFFDGQIPHHLGKKEFKTLTLGPYKRAKTPPQGHFPQLFTTET